MKARDVMTSAVVSVSPETPISEVAKILRDNGISAVPVVDKAGAPVGMVSEGDLLGRNEADREARRDWWLTLLAEGETLSADFLGSLRAAERRAQDVMAAPVVTVGVEMEVSKIARLLTAYRIKRVPVLRDGRIVGIVSRADILRAVAAEAAEQTKAADRSRGGGQRTHPVASMERRSLHDQHEPEQAQPAEAPPVRDDTRLLAADFRRLAADHENQELQHRREQRRVAAEGRRRRVAELIEHHISEESWRSLIHQARLAAERGEKEFQLLRFPSQLCGDGGRAINAGEPHWPATLRGEAAEIYLRWERDLKPHDFRLSARVLDFPDGMPGDIGLLLTWGE
ncbi:MAG TPA: CBS domain-containing protein [Stellaceae bacterium]